MKNTIIIINGDLESDKINKLLELFKSDNKPEAVKPEAVKPEAVKPEAVKPIKRRKKRGFLLQKKILPLYIIARDISDSGNFITAPRMVYLLKMRFKKIVTLNNTTFNLLNGTKRGYFKRVATGKYLLTADGLQALNKALAKRGINEQKTA